LVKTLQQMTAGRPAGKVARKRIELPGGDAWVPLYSTFSEATGINAKTLQRMRHRLPTAIIAGVLYVKDAAGRSALAEPKKARGARR
jgi:hypothetical protein